jgi:hypothetical protein
VRTATDAMKAAGAFFGRPRELRHNMTGDISRWLACINGFVCSVRLTPKSGHVRCNSVCPLCANSGHETNYSINSSVRAISVGGTVKPSALAVLRLMANWNLTGACTGRSLGFSPLRMRSI